jgi:hypothetical protein
MIVGSEVVLGLFVVGFAVALVQQFEKANPQTTIGVFAQLALVAVIGGLVMVMIAVARNPTLTFSPKLVFRP